jgi:hypothetical protein
MSKKNVGMTKHWQILLVKTLITLKKQVLAPVQASALPGTSASLSGQMATAEIVALTLPSRSTAAIVASSALR